MMHLSIPFKMSDFGSIQSAEGTTGAQTTLDAGATPATDEQVRAFEALVEAIHGEGEVVGDLAEGTTGAQTTLDAGATPATDEQVRAFEALVEAIHGEGEVVGDLAEGTTGAQTTLDAGATPATDEQVRAFEALVEAIHGEGEAVGDLKLSIGADGTPMTEEAGGALHAAPVSIQMLLARAAELIAGKEGQPGAVKRSEVAAKRAEVAASVLPFASSGATGLDTQALKGLPMLAESAEGLVGMERVMAALSDGNRNGRETGMELFLRPESAGTGAAAGALQPAAGPLSALTGEGALVPGRRNFNGALAQQVRWLVDQGTETAELRLEPPRLGSLGVRVRMEGDQAVLNFQSAHASVREAVEAAVPRLRELLSEAGIDLVDVHVGTDDGARQWSTDADTGEGAGAGSGGGSDGEHDSGNEAAGSGIELHPTIGIFDGYA